MPVGIVDVGMGLAKNQFVGRRAGVAGRAAVRHLLPTHQCLMDAQRVIAYRAALALDEAAYHESPEHRDKARRLAALLTPVVKSFCTEQGFESASRALQVFGGYGYVREYAVGPSWPDGGATLAGRVRCRYCGSNRAR